MTVLTRIHKVSVPDALHLVFVHGLGGDARSTWMYNPKDDTTLWPSWIGEEVGCNVWVAGYGAALSGWTDAAMHLVDLGEALFAALQVERDLQGHRVVLVGHSLGGLVIKSGMTQAQVLGDPLRLTLLQRIAGVVFVGTPHQGSSLATVAHNLRLLLRTNAQVSNMVNGDAWLKLLNGQFRSLQEQRNFGVRVFFESKGVFIGRRICGLAIGKRQLIVDRNSSDPEIAGVIPTAIEGDHIEIAKPKSRQALIHKALVEFLKGMAIGPESPPPTSDKRTPAPWAISTDLRTALRSASAPLLSWPSTLSDGTWLHRQELSSLIESLASDSSSTHFLLGDPGCGKSSLLVRLAQERQAAGWYVLAIKADRLPPDVLDQQALAKHLNLEADTATILRALARTAPVLVLIDQVDALADLVVQQSARLRVLLDLVQDLSEAEGVHTVISCRTFEQKHDPALRNLDATVIRLELPEWSTVKPVLVARGLQADVWNQDIQQVLRSPHALEIFLSLLGGATEPEVLRSFQGLLEKQWETQVLSDTTGRRRTTLRHLAKLMADHEVLGLPLVKVEDHYTDIQALAAAGLLRLDQGPGRVEFRHQTLYEFVRARTFLEESGSLTETVRTQQGSLRIRPQMWHALGYFRGASPEEYGVEIGRLWAADLRPHLKMLLIEFLGLQTTPTSAERQLVEQAMTDQWFVPRFIGAAVGSPGWFAALLPAHLPRLMALPGDQAQALLPMLRQALHFSSEAVVDLVRRHWLNDADRDVLSWQVLGGGDVAPQAGLWLDSLVLIAGRSPIAEWAIGHVAGVISAAQPEEAPRLIAAWLRRQMDAATAPLANAPKDDETAYAVMAKNIQTAFEARQFHDMETIAEAAPRAFVIAMWPLLLEGLQHFDSEAPSVVIGYRQNRGLMFQELDDEEARYERPLLRSFQLGIQGWADSDPDGFLDFVTANAQSELLLVHRFLALGLVRAAAHASQRVFDYLRGDSRRLVLGPCTDVHKESIAMIAEVSSLLDDPSYAELETILRDWRYYNEAAQQDDAGTRQQRQQWARQHRLRLLRALPEGRRSAALQRFVNEEERAFPGLTDKDVHFSGAQWIGSPLSAQQMGRATDADVLNLFSELTDDTAWDHPRHRMKGGAIQAGRELAELAKRDLAKVLRIVRSLDPGSNEIPVSCTLRELIPAGLTEPAFYSLVSELEDKGFVGSGFRRDAAYAIANAASKETPVPDELIDRMERWLIPCATEDAAEIEADAKETSSPVLWGHGSIVVLPNGNYPTLTALTSACLSVEPPRLDRWLFILERHAARAESSRVWEALIQRELTYLRMADCSRVEALVDQVISTAPSILAGRGFARFVAYAFRWASVAAVRRWMMGLVETAGKGQQAAGELACLRHALFPAEDWSREMVEALSGDAASDTALGVAHAVANLWHEPMTRPVVHPIMLLLLRSNVERVLTALSAIFMNDGFAADAETRELLDVLVVYPSVLRNGRAERLPEILVKLVASEPARVCTVVHALLDAAGDQMGNIATSWYLSTEWLLDIALQLQDMGAAERAAGSELFERMLEFNMPQAREMTLDLDKRTPVDSRPRAPVRRRSRTKLRKTTR
ncbi:alpha/beta fold hydrolase [Marichromatium sp. AB32]|uniref:alpha/beta fold hydrolase n=1 Tax=Marichromatium sp. AB32 TaxID=2483363 RepID=UPI000F3D6B3E|nr:alpha/beta fold hydrolase [Marichromatium sp. AB32]RNE90161.1 AAA family ATPase [Marichromatium sp. AB32]